MRAAKAAIARAEELPLSAGLEFERRAFFLLFATDDQKEGMDAFINKRPPDWQGAARRRARFRLAVQWRLTTGVVLANELSSPTPLPRALNGTRLRSARTQRPFRVGSWPARRRTAGFPGYHHRVVSGTIRRTGRYHHPG